MAPDKTASNAAVTTCNSYLCISVLVQNVEKKYSSTTNSSNNLFSLFLLLYTVVTTLIVYTEG